MMVLIVVINVLVVRVIDAASCPGTNAASLASAPWLSVYFFLDRALIVDLTTLIFFFSDSFLDDSVLDRLVFLPDWLSS